jgi:hypothetical protein
MRRLSAFTRRRPGERVRKRAYAGKSGYAKEKDAPTPAATTSNKNSIMAKCGKERKDAPTLAATTSNKSGIMAKCEKEKKGCADACRKNKRQKQHHDDKNTSMRKCAGEKKCPGACRSLARFAGEGAPAGAGEGFFGVPECRSAGGQRTEDRRQKTEDRGVTGGFAAAYLKEHPASSCRRVSEETSFHHAVAYRKNICPSCRRVSEEDPLHHAAAYRKKTCPSCRRVLEETPPHHVAEENLSRKPKARESAGGFPSSLRALRAR